MTLRQRACQIASTDCVQSDVRAVRSLDVLVFLFLLLLASARVVVPLVSPREITFGLSDTFDAVRSPQSVSAVPTDFTNEMSNDCVNEGQRA